MPSELMVGPKLGSAQQRVALGGPRPTAHKLAAVDWAGEGDLHAQACRTGTVPDSL